MSYDILHLFFFKLNSKKYSLEIHESIFLFLFFFFTYSCFIFFVLFFGEGGINDDNNSMES